MLIPHPPNRIEPSLLVRPRPYRTEGPRGYLLRLAESNWLSFNDLTLQGILFDYRTLETQRLLPDVLLDPDLHRHVKMVSESLKLQKRAWNLRYCRFCPLCLRQDAHWRAGWEIMFHDACPIHGVWLIDRCSSCGTDISWQRNSLIRCQCGADLRMEQANSCPENVRGLSNTLLSKLLDSDCEYPIPLSKTDLEQSQRLIRYLGTYMHTESGRNPLKIHSCGLLSNSWPLTTLASEIIFDWPASFSSALDKIQADASGNDKRRIGGVFGQAYHYIYKSLKELPFEPVRHAFEIWMAASWKGSLAKRNKRLAEKVLENAEWIPATLARETLGISHQRLVLLIKEEGLDAVIDVTASGRKFTMVRRDQLHGIRDRLDGFIDMAKAGELLGFTKKRMRQLLRMLFPYARKSNINPSAKWQVPRHEVEHLVQIGSELKKVNIPDEGCVSLGHILKYWNWAVEDIHALIEAVKMGDIKPEGQLTSTAGITRWIFLEPQVKAWRAQRDQGLGSWVTVKQLCKMLNVHHDVAYGLVKDYFANGEAIRLPGKGFQIKRSEVERFQAEFVFGTEVAAVLGVSPRKAKAILAEHHIKPVSGPDIDHIRQLIYLRDATLEAVILKLTKPGETEELILS